MLNNMKLSLKDFFKENKLFIIIYTLIFWFWVFNFFMPDTFLM